MTIQNLVAPKEEPVEFALLPVVGNHNEPVFLSAALQYVCRVDYIYAVPKKQKVNDNCPLCGSLMQHISFKFEYALAGRYTTCGMKYDVPVVFQAGQIAAAYIRIRRDAQGARPEIKDYEFFAVGARLP